MYCCEYKYTVIVRGNSTERDLASEWWDRHPEWNYMIRTDIRKPTNPDQWLSGGGVTLQEARHAAEFAVRWWLKLGESCLMIGVESREIIKNVVAGEGGGR